MLRIIHIVENLDKGAVENWLVKVFLESRKMRPDWEWTFYCILGKKGRLDEIVTGAGGKIIYSPYWISSKYKFLRYLRSTLKTGKFDIIHSHHDYLSGFHFLASVSIKFKKRILHIHNNEKALPIANRVLRKALLAPLKKLSLYFSDTVVGISIYTLKEYLGRSRVEERKGKVLYCGIDMESFSEAVDKNVLRERLKIPSSSKILLFAGRLAEFKNPVFVVDILSELLRMRKDVYALFVGPGDIFDINRKAKDLGIEKHVRVISWSDEVSYIMRSSDVFIFPRAEYPKEGLGLVIVEAQAAGLPVVLSRGVPEDAIEIDELAHFVALNNNPDVWASEISGIIDAPPAIEKHAAYNRMSLSRFELKNATRNFIALYEDQQ